MLLIHGLGSRGSDWQPQIKALSEHYQVIAVDLPGHGDSELSPLPLTMSNMARGIQAVLDSLALEHAHVIGFSLGGMVAQQLALDVPERVLSLTLINSGPCALPGKLKRSTELGLRSLVIRLLGMKRLAKIVAGRIFPRAEQSALAEHFIQQLSQMPRNNYLAALGALKNWDIRSRLGEIKMPCLVIAADGDYVPVHQKMPLVKQMPCAELAVVRDSGHASPLDQPAVVNQLLIDFLSRQKEKLGQTWPGADTITTLQKGDVHAFAP